MSDEKDLIKRRGSFKGRLTVFANYVQSLAKPVSTGNARELKLRIGKVEVLYEQYDEVQLQLECLSESMQSQIADREEFEKTYYKTLADAQGLLAENESTPYDKCSQLSNHKLVKLPTIQLPKFSGTYSSWLEFHDTFNSLIHSNDDIDEINKFHYLRASLEGSAAVVIQSIDFSANNYLIAWNLLCERYNNKRLLIKNHVTALFTLEQITRESSYQIKNLIDQLNKNLRALESLGEPVKQWDTLLIYIVTQKLDRGTYREWEEAIGRLDDQNKSFDIFLHFLRTRADLIETLEMSRNNLSGSHNKSNVKLKSMISQSSTISSSEQSPRVCPNCKGDHNLNICPQFLALSNEARLKLLPSLKVCFNCFRTGHFANSCKRLGCKICKRRHHSLVHQYKSLDRHAPGSENARLTLSSLDTTTAPSTNSSNVTLSANVPSNTNDVLLSTALIKIIDNNNCEHIVRVVLDSGSTSCLISQNLCRRINAETTEINRSILGINHVTSHVGKTCRINIKSLDNCYDTDICCFVLPSITSNIPGREIDISKLNIPSDICLADPTFFKPSQVDVLIGADLFWDLIESQQIRLGKNKPVLCKTRLGWIISGPLPIKNTLPISSHIMCNFVNVNTGNISEVENINNGLSRFWQLEEVDSQSPRYMPEERLCEEHFVDNMSHLDDGRFCVRLRLKQSPKLLGSSYERSKQCLLSLERILANKPEMSKMYHEFMSEYQSMGHMTEINASQLSGPTYFMPHHGVVRECSSTTKLRVVFNASCVTTSGISLNDIQLIGPTVQDDLLSLLLRFRQHKYILSADVEKMYRQIVVHPSDRNLQLILWRERPSDPIKVFQLNTVTYGTASAPFLATRCLKQIGLECSNPRIAQIIQHDFYVDDLLTGGDDLTELQEVQKQITKTLSASGMPLRKWVSNDPQLVSKNSDSSFKLDMGCNEPNKLLGLSWCVSSDKLCFPIGSSSFSGSTKRDVLSTIARIFDPLGLLAPCVILMKILLQRLWLSKVTWDEPLTPEIKKTWNAILSTFNEFNNLYIPRGVIGHLFQTLELHIFVDASELAYGACAYVRSVNNNGVVIVRLLMAKSRVAPLKPTTIPRLELCGALIGARIYEKVKKSLRVKFNRNYMWTDSMIVLGWLRMLPSKLQPFVRNRVAEILERASNVTWKHVPTNENPADLISRGLDISNLQGSSLWWSGPEFLIKDSSEWPSRNECVELPEVRSDVSLNIVLDNASNKNACFVDFSRFSNYTRLVRSVAYAFRFIELCKKTSKRAKFLEEYELRNALFAIIKTCQAESFPEYKLLINKQKLPKKNPLLKFNIFLDANYIMRVGGRLDNSNFSFNKKHPIIIQSTHIFTKLLFEFEHKRMMHAGPQLLLASIRETYWPIGGRNLARLSYRNCLICNRMRGTTVNPLMGNLPQQRLVPEGYPFENVGVDYAGPIMCASRQGRGCRLVKTYMAIFICFTTKAVHLELVGDLTSNRYIMALRRFISRRGKPTNLYSDNGTSFVGAFNDISKFLKNNCHTLGESLAGDGINFHFIPAYTPHFGGLWEAGVKSAKYHLQRVLGNCKLTFEELNTTLTQIEAIMNSRPLTPLSSDPADCNPLTPGHFLIGRPLTSLPEQDLQQHSTDHLSRFHRIQQLRQHFWTRWSKEYVAELQHRVKWRSCQKELQLNSLVLVKEDNLPPLKWKLGRIVAVHPGADNIVRVADIRTSTGVIRRAFSKICPLPLPVSG